MFAKQVSPSVRCLAAGVAVFAFPLLLPQPEMRQLNAEGSGSAVVRVEEDWKLVLNEPDSDVSAPQFHSIMSPYGHLSQAYAQVYWNYRELPDFNAGGLQVQGWYGEESVDLKTVSEDSLSRDAEAITWTQRLELEGGKVKFSVVNGRSSSWGNFGGNATKVAMPGSLSDLGQYSASVSKANSWITYGANRVNSLVILRVRKYAANGSLLSTDDTPKIVYQYQD